MQTFEIKNRYTDAVIYSGGGESLRDVVVAAVKGGAYLRGADLSDKPLAGDRPILQIGPVGSRSDYLVAYMTAEGVYVQAGCFFGALDDFRKAVSKTHGICDHWARRSAQR